MNRFILTLCVLVCLIGGAWQTHTSAQDAPLLPTPQVVSVEASDGLVLQGDFYQAPDGDGRTVLLLHMLGSNRKAWAGFLPYLLNAGYHVLNVDMRGHGDTKGTRDWVLAEGDIATWFVWVRQQDGVRGESISVIGASIGSNLAMIGCATDAQCVTAIALSPGLDFHGVMPAESAQLLSQERSVLLVAGEADAESSDGVRTMAADMEGDFGVRIYPRSAHGTELLRGSSTLMKMLVAWLDEHTPAP